MAELIKKWYAIQTLSGREDDVKEAIETLIETRNLQDYIESVEVPIDIVRVHERGKIREKKKKVLPSYVFIKMVYDENLMYEISNIEGVVKFVGDRRGPKPMSEKEVQKIIRRPDNVSFESDFEEGGTVKIVNGPFKDFMGKINNIDYEKGKLEVMITVLGRETPIEVEFKDVIPMS